MVFNLILRAHSVDSEHKPTVVKQRWLWNSSRLIRADPFTKQLFVKGQDSLLRSVPEQSYLSFGRVCALRHASAQRFFSLPSFLPSWRMNRCRCLRSLGSDLPKLCLKSYSPASSNGKEGVWEGFHSFTSLYNLKDKINGLLINLHYY